MDLLKRNSISLYDINVNTKIPLQLLVHSVFCNFLSCVIEITGKTPEADTLQLHPMSGTIEKLV